MSDRIYTIPYESIDYEGVKYRSKLECRWHVFLDTLGIIHIYEPKRFYFGDTIYTPDFGIVAQEYDYIEVKPTNPTPMEYYKCRALSSQGFKVALFAGKCSPDVQVYLWENGTRRYIPRSSAFLQQCFQFRLTGRQGETIAALKTVLGKRGNFTKAFKVAWGFKV